MSKIKKEKVKKEKTEKTYSRVDEAEKLIGELCAKYPDELWAVRPSSIAVLGIENKERGKNNRVLAKITATHGANKALLKIYDVPIRHMVILYWSDWNKWTTEQKQWILFHELFHLHPEDDKLVKHDCQDFNIILDIVGINWVNSKLPDLLAEKQKFNLNLRPNVQEDTIVDDEKDENDDDEKDIEEDDGDETK